eukprot:3799547-Prymnesium_polylepis.1
MQPIYRSLLGIGIGTVLASIFNSSQVHGHSQAPVRVARGALLIDIARGAQLYPTGGFFILTRRRCQSAYIPAVNTCIHRPKWKIEAMGCASPRSQELSL